MRVLIPFSILIAVVVAIAGCHSVGRQQVIQDSRVKSALHMRAVTLECHRGMTEDEVNGILGKPAQVLDESQSPIIGSTRTLVYDVPGSANARFAVVLSGRASRVVVTDTGFLIMTPGTRSPMCEFVQTERFWRWLKYGPSREWLGKPQSSATDGVSLERVLAVKDKSLSIHEFMKEDEVRKMLGKPSRIHHGTEAYGSLFVADSLWEYDLPGSENAVFVVGLRDEGFATNERTGSYFVSGAGFKVITEAGASSKYDMIEPVRFWRWLEYGPAQEWLQNVDWAGRDLSVQPRP